MIVISRWILGHGGHKGYFNKVCRKTKIGEDDFVLNKRSSFDGGKNEKIIYI